MFQIVTGYGITELTKSCNREGYVQLPVSQNCKTIKQSCEAYKIVLATNKLLSINSHFCLSQFK